MLHQHLEKYLTRPVRLEIHIEGRLVPDEGLRVPKAQMESGVAAP